MDRFPSRVSYPIALAAIIRMLIAVGCSYTTVRLSSSIVCGIIGPMIAVQDSKP